MADEQGWQPIETAPKVAGAEILIVRRGRVTIGWWDEDKYGKKPIPFWNGHDAWHERLWAKRTPPTHWMPLPAPPQAEAGS